MSKNCLTYLYSLTPLHTGGSADAGNLMGIAREVQTEFPYLPSSSVRGKIRAEIEAPDRASEYQYAREAAERFFGQKIKGGQQPTEGEVWFADATLLLFPIASFSHQFLWVTCPLWLSRWNRWLQCSELDELISSWKEELEKLDGKKAVSPLAQQQIYLQGAILNKDDVKKIDDNAACWQAFESLPTGNGILNLKQKLVVLSDSDCGALLEMGLQREVRIALEEGKKTAQDGSFRSEEALPSESVLFFPWGFKATNRKTQDTSNKTQDTRNENQNTKDDAKIRNAIENLLGDRVQFGGLESLGRGWMQAKTISIPSKNTQKGGQ